MPLSVIFPRYHSPIVVVWGLSDSIYSVRKRGRVYRPMVTDP